MHVRKRRHGTASFMIFTLMVKNKKGSWLGSIHYAVWLNSLIYIPDRWKSSCRTSLHQDHLKPLWQWLRSIGSRAALIRWWCYIVDPLQRRKDTALDTVGWRGWWCCSPSLALPLPWWPWVVLLSSLAGASSGLSRAGSKSTRCGVAGNNAMR